MSKMAVQYIEVIQSQLMEDLRGRVSMDDLALELNKAVTAFLAKEVGTAVAELVQLFAWGYSEQKIEAAESKVKRTMHNLEVLLNRNMENRVVGVSLQLSDGEEQK